MIKYICDICKKESHSPYCVSIGESLDLDVCSSCIKKIDNFIKAIQKEVK